MSGLITAPDSAGPLNLDTLPSSVSERVNPLDTLNQMERAEHRQQAMFGVTDPATGEMIQPPEASVPKAALEKDWSIAGPTPGLSLHFTADLPLSVAIDMNRAKRDEIARANAQARSPRTLGSRLSDMGMSFLDPVGLAASALPVVGEARIGALLGRAGIDLGEGFAARTALRAGAGAVSGSLANLPVAALRYGLSQQEQADYGMWDAARDVAYGAPLGGVLHPLLGAAGEAAQGLHSLFGLAEPDPAARLSPSAHAATMQAGLAAAMDERPFDAGSVLAATATRHELETGWYSHAQDAEDLQAEIAALPTAPPQDTATAERLAAVQQDLADPALPAGRRTALEAEHAMLTEGQSDTSDADALFQARTEAQRTGLSIALDRTHARVAAIEDELRAIYAPAVEQLHLGDAYDQVRAAPAGAADDPLVRITPEDIQGAIVARGGFKGIGDASVKGSGWGLVKFIWRHGEESNKLPESQITRDDLLAFPEVIRSFAPSRDAGNGQGREWRVQLPGADGKPRTVVFADNVLTGRGDTPHLVSVHVQEAGLPGADRPLSALRTDAPGSTDGTLEASSGYRRGSFDREPQGQGAPAADNIGTTPPRVNAPPDTTPRQAEQAGTAAPARPDAVPPEATPVPMPDIDAARAAGLLDATDDAEISAAGKATEASEAQRKALAQAASCIAGGLG